MLNQMSDFWFSQLGQIVPNHLTGIAPESVAAVGIPYKLGLVVAIVGGIAAAVVADRMTSSPDTESNVS